MKFKDFSRTLKRKHTIFKDHKLNNEKKQLIIHFKDLTSQMKTEIMEK